MKEDQKDGNTIPMGTVCIFILDLEKRNTTEYNRLKPEGYPDSKDFKELYGVSFSDMAFRRNAGIKRFNFKKKK